MPEAFNWLPDTKAYDIHVPHRIVQKLVVLNNPLVGLEATNIGDQRRILALGGGSRPQSRMPLCPY